MAVKKTVPVVVKKAAKATRPTFQTIEKDGKTIQTAEGKHDRFKFYANLRVSKMLKLYKQIGNLSNRSIYSYSDAELAKILSALKSGLTAMEDKLANTTEKSDNSFRLD